MTGIYIALFMSPGSILLVLALSLILYGLGSGILSYLRDRSDSRSAVLSLRTLGVIVAFAAVFIIRSLWTIGDVIPQILQQRDIGFILLFVFSLVCIGSLVSRFGMRCLIPFLLLGISLLIDAVFFHFALAVILQKWRLTEILLALLFLTAAGGAFFFLYDVWHHQLTMRYRYTVAFFAATIITGILIMANGKFTGAQSRQDPFLLALSLMCIVMAWKLLFSPGHPGIKATLIATSVFWLQYTTIRNQSSPELLIFAIAVFFSSGPALLLCAARAIRDAHRVSFVFLSFLGGILSTAPIVLYNVLVQNITVVNFFIVTVTFRSIPSSASLFLNRDVFAHFTALQTTLTTQLVIFLFLALLEEGSKAWMVHHGSAPFSRSATELLWAGILVAIGFSVAENMLNPTFFLDAVRTFIAMPDAASLARLVGTMVSRSFVVAFVHILATSVSTYYMGRALFASHRLEQQFGDRQKHPVLGLIHRTLFMKAELTFQHVQYFLGITYAVLIHGAFNYFMILLDILRNAGETSSPIVHRLLLLMPGRNAALPISFIIATYFIAGGWLLTRLFASARRMHANGDLLQKDIFDAPQKTLGPLDNLLAPTLQTSPAPNAPAPEVSLPPLSSPL